MKDSRLKTQDSRLKTQDSRLKKLGLSFIGLFLVAEVGLRFTGAIDFPIYHKDIAIGYVPAASQQGKFMNKNGWVLNETSLGTEKSWPKDGKNIINIMLVGDSVVWGGNPLDQTEKMAAKLEQRLGTEYAVWPASAGGWSAANEIEMIRRNKDLYIQANQVVWVLNSGDLAAIATSSEKENIIHPSSKPLSAIFYYTQKYLLPKLGIKIGSENPAIDTNAGINKDVLNQVRKIIAQRTAQGKPVLILQYPDINEVRQVRIEGYKKLKIALIPVCAEQYVTCIDLIQDKRWNDKFYRDGIHPSVEGNRRIAEFLSQYVQHL